MCEMIRCDAAGFTQGGVDLCVAGRVDLKGLFINSCAGDFPQSEMGGVRFSNRAM